MLSRIKEPVLHACNSLEDALEARHWAAYPMQQAAAFEGNMADDLLLNPLPDIPQFRKYQNRHIAPTRMYVGGSSIAVGGVMMFAGYRQDTKYPWSGPYMSLSPLNVFGVLIVLVGLCFIASGLIFYSKYKKHTIAPYNKSY